MKQLSKIMLAAVASVALAAPAFAWDFSASGSQSVTFNKTDTTIYTGATVGSGGGVASDGGAISLTSSHTDGAKTASFSYALDWDGNLDETVSMSGSNKVGNWTASGSVAYNRGNNDGCSNAADDNTSATSTAAGAAECTNLVAEQSQAAITLTDGTMTIVFGNAGHLSGQNVSSGGAANGQATMDGGNTAAGTYPVGAESSVGAMVGTYQGVSLGYAISDTMTVTGAYQADGSTGDMMGTGGFLDGETSASHGTSGFGVGFSGTFGPATIGFTQASASTADGTGSATLGKKGTSWSTMGLGVSIDLGDIDPFISYGSATGTASECTTCSNIHGGSEFGLTYALGTDSVVLLIGSTSDQYSTTDKPLTKSSMELGYSTTVGPASLSVGYGTVSHADADKVAVAGGDGYSQTDIEVAMGFSF